MAAQNTPLYDTIRATLASFPELELGIVYGSTSAGRAQPASDVDIAVLADRPLSFARRMEMQAELEKTLHREVDLVDLSSLHGPLLHQIFAQGSIVLKRSAHCLAFLLKRLWYDREDMAPLTRHVLQEQAERYFRDPRRHTE